MGDDLLFLLVSLSRRAGDVLRGTRYWRREEERGCRKTPYCTHFVRL